MGKQAETHLPSLLRFGRRALPLEPIPQSTTNFAENSDGT
jgi:hypothetical protein